MSDLLRSKGYQMVKYATIRRIDLVTTLEWVNLSHYISHLSQLDHQPKKLPCEMDQEVIKLLPFLDCEDLEELFLITISDNRDPIPRQTKVFKLQMLSEEFCFLNFRFYKADLGNLKNCLSIPSSVICDNRLRVNGMEALCIMLRRLAYPNRYVDLMRLFPRTRCELSRIFNFMVTFILEKHGHLISGLDHPMLKMCYIVRLAKAVAIKGVPYSHCFGFLDGTVRPICRQQSEQKEYYNGHKRTHALKFQALMLPDGIIASMHGPVNGRRHDAYLLANSGLLDILEARFYDANREPYFLYGDPAYPLRPHNIVPFKNHHLNLPKRVCNKRMSGLRECVEWGYSKFCKILPSLI